MHETKQAVECLSLRNATGQIMWGLRSEFLVLDLHEEKKRESFVLFSNCNLLLHCVGFIHGRYSIKAY